MRHLSRWSPFLAVMGLAMLLAFVGAHAQSSSLLFSRPYDISDPNSSSSASQLGVGDTGTVYAVWEDDTNGYIWFSRSDGSATFFPNPASPTNISCPAPANCTAWPYNPRLAVENNGVTDSIDIIWLAMPPGSSYFDVFFARSTDGGATFSSPVNLSNDPAETAEPQIAVGASGNIHVVWEVVRTSDFTPVGVSYTRSVDGGASFSGPPSCSPMGNQPCSLASNPNGLLAPQLAVAGNNVYLAWEDDFNNNLQSDISFRRSADGGDNFLPAQYLTANHLPPINNNNFKAIGAKLAVDASGNLEIAWLDNTSGNYELMFSQSTDNGTTFSPAVDVSLGVPYTTKRGDAGDQQMATDAAGNVYLIWREKPDSSPDIYFARSTSTVGGVTFSSPVNLSNDGNSVRPWLNLDAAGNINVSWEDDTFNTSQILFTQWTNNGATFSSPQNLSNDTGSSTDVQVVSDKNGNLNVVWTDNASGKNQILFSRHTNQVNQPPVANAGADQVLDATGPTTPVTLDGSLSSDADGDALTFVWMEGTTVVGKSAVVQLNLNMGVHTFTLTVTDTAGFTNSAVTHVTINNQAPLANAGPDQTLPASGVTTPVTLNGSASIDPDGDALTFVWTEGATVVGNLAVVQLNLSVGLHTFTLMVKDPGGLSSSAITHVTIKPNQPPVAKVGPDQNIYCAPRTGATVTLDGSQSSDPDGDTLGFVWTDEANHIVGTSAVVHVTVPAGMHAFTLTVGDPGGLSAQATTHVTVNVASPPTLDVSVSPNVLWPPNHKMVQVTATINIADTCDPNPAVKLVSIARSDNNSGDNVQAVGGGPVPFGADVRSFLVRSENSDTSGDLVYTIVYCVTDRVGNSTNASALVTVSNNGASSPVPKPGNNKRK